MNLAAAWVQRVSTSRANYWATYVVDVSLLAFFIAWDTVRFDLGAALMATLIGAGAVAWTLTEYSFHRWVYHMEFTMMRSGHDLHHEDPTAYVAMPWFVTPVLFLPVQQVVGGWLGVGGFSTFLAGWFGGFIAYSYLHHCLHHYKLRAAWFRHLQSEHRIHHALPEKNFGVTMRFWDRVFGTEFTK